MLHVTKALVFNITIGSLNFVQVSLYAFPIHTFTILFHPNCSAILLDHPPNGVLPWSPLLGFKVKIKSKNKRGNEPFRFVSLNPSWENSQYLCLSKFGWNKTLKIYKKEFFIHT